MVNKKKIKVGIGDRIYSGIIYIILFLFGVAALYPFLHVIAVSLSSSGYVSGGLVSIFPKGFNLEAYMGVLTNKMIYTGYKNTIYVTVMTTVLGVIVTAMTAYPLSRDTLPGKKFFLIFISITILFHAGMIPRFLVMKQLGLLDSLNGLVLAALTSGYNVTVMRSFFMNIPKSLEESASLDGCNDMQILFKIVFPLSKSILSTVALWIMVACWNAFFDPMLFLNDIDKYTLQIFLRDIVVKSSRAANDAETGIVASDSVKYATIMVATIPVLVVYPFIQKYFVQGVTAGAVKG
ncbi:MAG: carbohydrate ABC transporter permease [Clostridia bacterium]|nr:carbohydrate ABC transporter permease [Clostridia bacterium]